MKPKLKEDSEQLKQGSIRKEKNKGWCFCDRPHFFNRPITLDGLIFLCRERLKQLLESEKTHLVSIRKSPEEENRERCEESRRRAIQLELERQEADRLKAIEKYEQQFRFVILHELLLTDSCIGKDAISCVVKCPDERPTKLQKI